MHVSLFILPMIFLIPTPGNTERASVMFIVALFCIWRTITTWLPFWRSIRNCNERLWETVWLLAGPLAA